MPRCHQSGSMHRFSKPCARRWGTMGAMADHLRDELTRLLDEFEARRRGDREREQKTKDDDARFLVAFAELRRNVIRPVFEMAGTLLEERGHRYSIVEHEF